MHYIMNRRMGKPTIYIGENKGADQLRSNAAGGGGGGGR